MNKTTVGLFLFFLVVGGMGLLFSRWWRDRTGKSVLPQATVSPTPRLTTSNLSSLLAKMRPLTDSEKALELSSEVEWMTGLVRYSEEGNEISYSVFLLPTKEPADDLYLWVKSEGEVALVGLFENGKGGLLVSGKLNKADLPIELIVAPKVKNQIGEALLSGSM